MQLYLFGGAIIAIFLTLIFIVRIVRLIAKEYLHVNKNKSYIDIQNYFCEVAYDNIYKDQMLAFSSSGYKPGSDQLETAKRNFVKLVIQLLGPTQYQYLSDFFGSSDNFHMNLLIWFTSKMDQDEIIKWATDTNEMKQKNDDIISKAFETKVGAV